LALLEDSPVYKADPGLETPELEQAIAEAAAAMAAEERPLVKNLLIDRLLVDAHELKRRYTQEADRRRDLRRKQFNS